MENRPDGRGKSARAIAALPALMLPVAAHVMADMLALAVWANRATVPAHGFKIFDRLFVRLKRLEEFENVHGFALLTKPSYSFHGLCQVQKRTIPNQINLSLSVEFKARGLSKQAGETIGSFGSLSLTNARIPTASGG
jgi:hypothetical protein